MAGLDHEAAVDGRLGGRGHGGDSVNGRVKVKCEPATFRLKASRLVPVVVFSNPPRCCQGLFLGLNRQRRKTENGF